MMGRRRRRARARAAVDLCIAVDRYIERRAESDSAVRADLWRKMTGAADVFRDGRTTSEMKRRPL